MRWASPKSEVVCTGYAVYVDLYHTYVHCVYVRDGLSGKLRVLYVGSTVHSLCTKLQYVEHTVVYVIFDPCKMSLRVPFLHISPTFLVGVAHCTTRTVHTHVYIFSMMYHMYSFSPGF
jgi:hypothetical protein